MTELELKYGCNPNQKPARIFMENGELPLKVLNGKPGYINFMDALNSWQLVKALKKATGLPAAASFKHVSPAGAALGLPLTDVERHIYFAPEGELSPIACAYIRARGADRLCSFGDWAALSDVWLQNVVTENKDLPQQAKHDMLLSLITLKYTQSNSVCYVKNGMTIGVGAGQQSRIHCTRLAGNKADIWWLRQHPKVLGLQFVDKIRRPDRDNAIDLYISEEHDDVLAEGTWQNIFQVKPEVLTQEEKAAWIAQMSGVTVGSDAFFPFGDNVERARKSGVQYIAQPGGSIRDDQVIATANKHGMVMAFTGIRLFHH